MLVTYGNRQFDDALLELHDLALIRGFAPSAAASVVSEHSLSTADSPMAAGRPDTEDLGKARDFGAAVLAKLKSGASGLSIVPGNRPFKPYPDFHRAPVTSDNCTACGFCVSACPTGAIYIERDKALTREQDCIVCQACVKGCPEKARADISPGAKETREHLAPLVTGRKGVEIFL